MTPLHNVSERVAVVIQHLDNTDRVNVLGGMLAGLLATIPDIDMRREWVDQLCAQLRAGCGVRLQ